MLNEDKKMFKDLTPEERSVIVEAMVAGMGVEYLNNKEWTKTEDWACFTDSIYRITLRKPSINWDHVRSEFNWIAEDAYGDCYLYEGIPVEGPDGVHTVTMGDCVDASAFESYEKGTCHWTESKSRRPE